jgi:hypothetical protein
MIPSFHVPHKPRARTYDYALMLSLFEKGWSTTRIANFVGCKAREIPRMLKVARKERFVQANAISKELTNGFQQTHKEIK